MNIPIPVPSPLFAVWGRPVARLVIPGNLRASVALLVRWAVWGIPGGCDLRALAV